MTEIEKTSCRLSPEQKREIAEAASLKESDV